MRFSPSTMGFYPDNVAYSDVPSDLIQISDELWQSLRGRRIEVGESGIPREHVPPSPTLADRAAVLLVGVDAHLNAAAKAKGYDNIINAALRAALPASPFHDEGVAFGNWMDQVYATCYQILAQVQAGVIEEPSLEELIPMLPVLVLPE